MYESFYGLNSKPFQLNPDPRFYFASKQHRRATAYLEYGMHQNEGFIVVTGEVGAGKTRKELLPPRVAGPHEHDVVPALFLRPPGAVVAAGVASSAGTAVLAAAVGGTSAAVGAAAGG